MRIVTTITDLSVTFTSLVCFPRRSRDVKQTAQKFTNVIAYIAKNRAFSLTSHIAVFLFSLHMAQTKLKVIVGKLIAYLF